MKKIIVMLMLCLLFACSIFIKPNHFTLTDYFDSGILHIYTKRPINETSLALSNIYISSSNDGASAGDIVGESLYFTNLEVDAALKKLCAQVKFTEYLSEQRLTTIYAYSKLIHSHKFIDKVKVNLQISIADEYAVIGWPVIYGSF